MIDVSEVYTVHGVSTLKLVSLLFAMTGMCACVCVLCMHVYVCVCLCACVFVFVCECVCVCVVTHYV